MQVDQTGLHHLFSAVRPTKEMLDRVASSPTHTVSLSHFSFQAFFFMIVVREV